MLTNSVQNFSSNKISTCTDSVGGVLCIGLGLPLKEKLIEFVEATDEGAGGSIICAFIPAKNELEPAGCPGTGGCKDAASGGAFFLP